MLTHLLGTILDNRMRAHDQTPLFQVLLFSRWLDTDSDIVRGVYKQTPIDLTEFIVEGSLTLDMADAASSLSLTVSVEGLNLNIFSNCMVQVREGEKMVDQSGWATTFTGWRLGQPASSESAMQGKPNPTDGGGLRGAPRTIMVTFISRERQFTDFEITSDGVWLPNTAKQTELNFVYRDQFDDIGTIAREVCLNAEWGLGLKAEEVLIGKLPYRIEKQLQFVQVSAWEALQQLLQVLHLVPGTNGEGKIITRSREIGKPTARSYPPSLIIAIAQPDSSFTQVNAVIVRGLSKEITEVVKADQKLTSISGTFGYFDPKIEYEDTWGADKQETYRVKVGRVVDGNGKTVDSPRIRHFHSDGFIVSVHDPQIDEATDFGFKVSIENDTLLIIGLLAALISGYTGATIAVTLLTPYETGTPGAQTTVNPGAVVAQIAASLLLLGGLYVLQQIGNFQFDIYGVPFETVYEEIRVDAILAQFGTQFGSQPFREWERKDVEITNYILSTEDDSVVPANAPFEPAVTNQGVRNFARDELAIYLAQQAMRQIDMVRDVLLEPADIILDERTGFRYFLKSITRALQRGQEAAIQKCEAYRLPMAAPVEEEEEPPPPEA